MAPQYIKYAKKCKKIFFPNYRGGGHGLFWPGGGYAHELVEQLLPKNFFRFGHSYFFANLFMGYINNIVMKNFLFHSTRVFISKE